MSPLTPDEIAAFRNSLSGIEMPEERKDELIRIVDNIAMSFVAQAFGLHPVQLSLSARANSRFLGIQDYARIGTNQEHITVDPGFGSAMNDQSPEGQAAP